MSFVSDEATPHTTVTQKNNHTKSLLVFLLVAIFLFTTLFSTGVFQLDPPTKNLSYADMGTPSVHGTTIRTSVRTIYTDLATSDDEYIYASDIEDYEDVNNVGDRVKRLEANHIAGHMVAGANIANKVNVRLDIVYNEDTPPGSDDKITFKIPYSANAVALGTDLSTKAYTQGNPIVPARPTAAQLSGTKDNSRTVTIRLTNGAITQGTTFNIFYAIYFTDRYFYDQDTADVTPYLTIDSDEDAAIGESLRITIEALTYDGLPKTSFSINRDYYTPDPLNASLYRLGGYPGNRSVFC